MQNVSFFNNKNNEIIIKVNINALAENLKNKLLKKLFIKLIFIL